MKKILVVILSIFLLILTSCFSWKYIWFYYPDKNNLEKFIESPDLNSIEECRNWVNWQWYVNWKWDYECWYKCRYDKWISLYICKTTEK